MVFTLSARLHETDYSDSIINSSVDVIRSIHTGCLPDLAHFSWCHKLLPPDRMKEG